MYVWWWWSWRLWIVFVLWLTNERHLALFPAGTIVRNPHYRESLTQREQCLKLHRTWVEWSCAVVITTTTCTNCLYEPICMNQSVASVEVSHIQNIQSHSHIHFSDIAHIIFTYFRHVWVCHINNIYYICYIYK